MEKIQHIFYPHIGTKGVERNNVIILEKIDGANLGIGYIDEKTISIQSRNRILVIVLLEDQVQNETIKLKGKKYQEYEAKVTNLVQLRNTTKQVKFFKLECIIDQLVSKVMAMRKELNSNFMVFGELFGDPLPKTGNESIKYHSAESVEKLNSDEVYYSAFDIILEDGLCLKHNEAILIYEKVNLPYMKQLDLEYKGLKELKAEVENFKSHYSDDIVEGFVFKKDEAQNKHKRAIGKLKRKAFSETKDNKVFNVKNFITENRLKNAYTKTGGDKQETIKYFKEDVTEAIMESLADDIKKYATQFANMHLKNYSEDYIQQKP